MDQQTQHNFLERRAKALKRYDDEITWYKRLKDCHRLTYQILQVLIIFFSGLTPILILVVDCPPPIQALPAALAGMLTAIVATFRLQDNWTRFAYTLEALKSEKFKFETRSTEGYEPNIDDQITLETFISRMEKLVLNEVTDWRRMTEEEEKSKKEE